MKYIKMPKALADKWLKALRSGNYRQGRGKLESVDECGITHHCCLGVLQMVVDGKVQPEKERDNTEVPTPEWLAAHGIVFYANRRKLSWCNPYLPSLSRTATEANDSGFDFGDIADAIEETLETY